MNMSHDARRLNRRRFLKYAGASVLTAAGGLVLPVKARAFTYASWVHGHAVIMGCEDPILIFQRGDNYAQVVRYGIPPTDVLIFCNFHFAIPTPVIMNGNRLRIVQALIDYQIENDNPLVMRVFDRASPAYTVHLLS